LKSDAIVQEEERRKEKEKLREKEHIKLMFQLAVSKLFDAGVYKMTGDLADRKLDHLFETEFERPDFLVRLGFFLVEVGLYPGRFQTKID